MSTLIKNAMIVTQNATRDIVNGDILIEGDKIVKMGKVNTSADTVIDASGDVVIPGLINTHSHVAMAIMKGIVDDMTSSHHF